MPIYAYECKDCGVRFERRQGFNDDPIMICPECEGNVHRLLQPPGIIFKGSGFYVTDNRGKKSGMSSAGSKSEGAAKSETKSETKPEAKTAPKAESKSSAD